MEIQKTETQKALDNFIRAEIARKSIEKDQLLRDAKTYAMSKDADLEEDVKLQAIYLEKEIKDLEKKIIE